MYKKNFKLGSPGEKINLVFEASFASTSVSIKIAPGERARFGPKRPAVIDGVYSPFFKKSASPFFFALLLPSPLVPPLHHYSLHRNFPPHMLILYSYSCSRPLKMDREVQEGCCIGIKRVQTSQGMT